MFNQFTRFILFVLCKYFLLALKMENLSQEEIAEFREIFCLVDRDGGGTISKEELGELMVRSCPLFLKVCRQNVFPRL